jgi:hydrogenase nickel incorporation protein HypA/HybF
MHEMSLAGGILRLVEQTCEREPFKRVTQLRIEAGALSGVEVSALRFAMEAMAPGTLIEHAVIDIDEPAAAAWCMQCSQSITIHSRTDACPVCGGYQIQPTGGTELRLVELLVE